MEPLPIFFVLACATEWCSASKALSSVLRVFPRTADSSDRCTHPSSHLSRVPAGTTCTASTTTACTTIFAEHRTGLQKADEELISLMMNENQGRSSYVMVVTKCDKVGDKQVRQKKSEGWSQRERERERDGEKQREEMINKEE